jgi:ornithine cyclodeaminase
MSANLLSAYRTGAIPGVGAKYLARKDSKTVAIIGPGVMGKTSLAAFMSVCPNLETVKIKGRGQKSVQDFTEFVKREFTQIKNIVVCNTMEEAVRDSDIISTTTSVGNKEKDFPYIDAAWIKKGALICMPSAARFDDSFYLDKNTKLVVDNYKLYEAWADEYPYPSYDPIQVVGAKFMDLLHDEKITREEIIDIADIITGKHKGRESEDERIIYSVGGMPVEDIAWGETVYKNALDKGIGVKLPLWDIPELGVKIS